MLDIENAQRAWIKADVDWTEFGRRSIPTTSPFTIKLGGLNDLKEELRIKLQEISDLSGGVYEKLAQERWDKLQPERKAIVEKDPKDRDPSERDIYKIRRSLFAA